MIAGDTVTICMSVKPTISPPSKHVVSGSEQKFIYIKMGNSTETGISSVFNSDIGVF